MPTNGHRVLLKKTMLGVTTAGPAFLPEASSPANKVHAIQRLDFTDAQGGKVACDRKVATIKVHMRFTKMSHTPFWGVNLPL